MFWLKKIFNKKSPINDRGIFCSYISKTISFTPTNINIYETAFTHRSLNQLNENGEAVNYERLEFLGDAILGSVIAAFLYQKAPKGDEGYLTQMRAKIVSRNHLNNIGKNLNLISFLKTKSSTNQFGENIHGNLLEALIGAIYIDAGFTCAEKFIHSNILINFENIEQLESKVTSYKSLFIEYCQKHKNTFLFEVYDDDGKDHLKHFSVKLYLNDVVIAKARATSKKKAEEKAAQRAFFSLQEALKTNIKK